MWFLLTAIASPAQDLKIVKAWDAGDYPRVVALTEEAEESTPRVFRHAALTRLSTNDPGLLGPLEQLTAELQATKLGRNLLVVSTHINNPTKAPILTYRKECPTQAIEHYNAAEKQFVLHNYAKAEKRYARALDGCNHAKWWLHRGDVHKMLGDNNTAARHYQRALDLEPCYWTAWRYLGDVQPEPTTFRLMAHACSPGDPLTRRDLDDELRKQSLPLLPPALHTDTTGWRLYQTALATTDASDPLARRVLAARSVLADHDTPLLNTLRKADDNGYLEGAVLYHLLDDALVPILHERALTSITGEASQQGALEYILWFTKLDL